MNFPLYILNCALVEPTAAVATTALLLLPILEYIREEQWSHNGVGLARDCAPLPSQEILS